MINKRKAKKMLPILYYKYNKLDEDDPDRSVSINLKTNGGFKNTKWEDYGL